ncbi:MAG: nucleotidyltransferase family protein [Chloroflexaceae bacterium]|nr:nucleotidyltransferase family protein [Chloroflexaceae bacterium]
MAHLDVEKLCMFLARAEHVPDWSHISPAEWEQLVTTAHHESVAPLLYHLLHTADVLECVPPQLGQSLRGSYRATLARNSLLFQELSRILHTVPDMPIVMLKGAALAPTLYGDIGLRPMSDIDLLVSHEHLIPLEHAFAIAGCRRVEMVPGLEDITGQVQLSGPHTPLAIDLHWGLIAGFDDRRSPPVDWFFEHAEPWALPDNTLHALQLSPTANLLYLSAHLMIRHGGEWIRLLRFYDLHLVCERQGHRVNWDELIERAAEYHWAASLYAAMQMTQQLFATPLPAGWLEQLAARCTPTEQHDIAAIQQLPPDSDDPRIATPSGPAVAGAGAAGAGNYVSDPSISALALPARSAARARLALLPLPLV